MYQLYDCEYSSVVDRLSSLTLYMKTHKTAINRPVDHTGEM